MNLETPEQMWDKFIAHLNQTEPLMVRRKLERGRLVEVSRGTHKAFLGSIDHYKEIFLKANSGSNRSST